MAGNLTIDELSRWTDEPAERLGQWRSLGLIGAEGSEGFRPEDVERARLVQDLLHHGMSLESIVDAAKEPGSIFRRYLDQMWRQFARPMYSVGEAAEIVGLEIDPLRRLMDAAGMRRTGEMIDEDDLAALRASKRALDAGYPEEGLLQLLRVYADALGRAAEATQRTTHFYLYDRLKASGLADRQLLETMEAAGTQLGPLVEPAILYFFRKGLERATRENAVTHLAEEAGLLEISDVPGQMQQAIAFVDLSSFTPLAEAMGDVKAAEVLERFSSLVRQAAGRWDGRVVKQIGDAFMVVFPEPRSAVACTLEIEVRVAQEPQFPAARSGVHWGPVLYREGDYVGSNVNIASRVAAEAQRHQVVVTAAVRKEAKELANVEFVRLGKRRLKGLANELVLFEARPSGIETGEKVIDPVCGMELGPKEIAARLSLEGKERAFCTDECLRRFVASPEKYSG